MGLRPVASKAQGRSGSGWLARKWPAASASMSELSASHWTARRLARTSRNAYHAGSRSGYSSWSSPLKRRKAPLPWMARASLRPARSSVIVSAKSAMSWYQIQDGSGSMQIKSKSSRLAGACPVDASIGRPEHDLSGLRVDQPPVLVAGLVGQRVSDLLQVQAAQLKHGARIDPLLQPRMLMRRYAERHVSAFPRRRLVKQCTKRFRGNVTAIEGLHASE